jgi:hypothetical protein
LEDGLNLGNWVGSQRKAHEQLTLERVKRLDELDFVWSPHVERWEVGFRTLVRFKEREGHCLVPQEYIEDGVRLGVWVANRRRTRDQLSPERMKRLDNIGFVWDALAAPLPSLNQRSTL